MAASVPAAGADEAQDAHNHRELSFASKYVFSTDHKMIAMQYMFTGIATQKIMIVPWLVTSALYSAAETMPQPGTSIPGKASCMRNA